jgi:hypothetical protein
VARKMGVEQVTIHSELRRPGFRLAEIVRGAPARGPAALSARRFSHRLGFRRLRHGNG